MTRVLVIGAAESKAVVEAALAMVTILKGKWTVEQLEVTLPLLIEVRQDFQRDPDDFICHAFARKVNYNAMASAAFYNETTGAIDAYGFEKLFESLCQVITNGKDDVHPDNFGFSTLPSLIQVMVNPTVPIFVHRIESGYPEYAAAVRRSFLDHMIDML